MTYSVYRRTVIQLLLVVFVGVVLSLVCLAKAANAAEIPISQGKSAVASSVTGATYGANQAVDGLINTKWATASTQLPQWLTVDLAQNVRVKRVETVFENVESTYQYKIETSTDGINWSTFSDQSNNTALNFPYYSDIGDVTARFVRIQVLGVGTPGDRASIYDFSVYTTNEALTLLSQNKTTAAYSSFSGWSSNKAVDGQLATSWAPSSVTLPQWLVVDLGQIIGVQRFETTYENQQEVYGYKIDFSVDGLTWYTFTDRTGNTQRGEPRYVDEGNVTARYFRLTTTGIGTPDTYAKVAEFQIYGPDGGTTVGNPQTLSSISLDSSSYTVAPGQTVSSYLTGNFANGSSQNISSGAVYSMSNTGVATVNANGVIAGVATGSTMLTVTYNGKTTTATVNVSATLANLNRIAFDAYSYSVQSGASRYPYVTGYMYDGSTQNLTSGITYVSSNPSVATINASGNITGLTAGSATITATYGNFSASATVYVTTAVNRIAADTSNVTMELYATRYVTINAYDYNNAATNVTSSTSFVSSNPSVVTVSSSGYLTAGVAGSSTITATYNGLSTTIYVTVGTVDTLVPTWNYGSTLTASQLTTSSVTLTWTAATDNVGVTSYRIYNDSNLLTTISEGELTTSLSDLSAGVNYRFKVEAGDLANNWSTSGPTTNVTLQNVLKQPIVGTSDQTLHGELTRENSPDGSMMSRVRVDDESLNNAIAALNSGSAATLTLHVQDYKDTTVIDFASSVFSNLQESVASATIRIEMDASSIAIPVRLLKNHANEAAEREGLFSVLIRHEAGQLAASVNEQMKAAHANLLLTNPIEFQINIGGTGLNQYDGMYVERSIDLPGASYAANSTAVRVDAATGETFFVPSTLTNSDGKWKMHIKDQYGGIYTVISANKSFADMKDHWARVEVETLASKGIITGVSGQTFEPDKEISRAEFAALLIRALGLRVNDNDASTTSFRDINETDWYAGVVRSASKAGLIQGYDDGSFRPTQHVSREQMAAMINRTIQSTGMEAESSDQETVLTPFKDQDAIDDWARESMAITLQNGLIQGVTETKLDPNANATRAQAVVMLKRLLVYMQFMN